MSKEKNMTAFNTVSAISLFSDELKDSLIFHIPHSKTEIPEKFKSDYVSSELVANEIRLLTDFATDEIFNISETAKVVFPYSRVFCDVERFDDAHEIMFEKGRGFYYTKTDNGELLRENTNGNKEIIYENYYKKHHELLTKLVDEKLNKYGFVTIVDCHSFSDTPFVSDIEQAAERPDFCLGTDEYHTPRWLKDEVYLFLKNEGYSVEINYPYVGTMVPTKHFNKNDSVHSIMIEVNRKLYMDSDVVDESKVEALNGLFSKLFSFE